MFVKRYKNVKADILNKFAIRLSTTHCGRRQDMDKKDILKMSKEEVRKLYSKVKVKEENTDCFNCFDCTNCSYCFDCTNCSNCFNCSDCTNCSNCSDCSYCTNQRKARYMLLDNQLTKKEYEEWKAKQ
jgi:hypothetical protein